MSATGHYGYTGQHFVGPTGTPPMPVVTSGGTAVMGVASTGIAQGSEIDSGWHTHETTLYPPRIVATHAHAKTPGANGAVERPTPPRQTVIAVLPKGSNEHWVTPNAIQDYVFVVSTLLLIFGCCFALWFRARREQPSARSP